MAMDEREYSLEHMKMRAQEIDARNRLYYGLWIVFMGGFVLSLHVSPKSGYEAVTWLLVVVFRLFAVAGTGINFWMQYQAIEALRLTREVSRAVAFGNVRIADAFGSDITTANRQVDQWGTYLLRLGALFLVLAFIGSFLVHVP